MNDKIGILGGLAGLQLVLIAVFWFGAAGSGDERPDLLDFEPDLVDRLTISDGDAELVLQRMGADEGQRWRVGDLPADQDKIDGLLTKMATLSAPWPVAQSAASAERFEVAADNFQRRVVLYSAEDVLADLYLGTSPGFQRVHARRADSDDVFSIGLSNFELAVGADDWLDKSLLALPDTPQRVAVAFSDPEQPAQVLEQGEDGWVINGEPAAQAEASTYANRYVNLRVLGEADETAFAQAAQLATIELTHAAGEATLTLSRAGDDGDYFVEDGARAGVYRLAAYIAEQLLMTDVDFTAADDTDDSQENAQDVSGE